MERGNPGNTFSTFPTNRFNFVLDPTCTSSITFGDPSFVLIEDLKTIEHSVYINIFFPSYLANQNEIDHVNKLRVGLKLIDKPTTSTAISLDESIQKDIINNYGGNREISHVLELLTLSDSWQLDGILT